MKINSIKAMLVVSLIIILLYVLGLFLPILENTKNSKIKNVIDVKVVTILKKTITFL